MLNQPVDSPCVALLYIDASLRSHRGHHANVCEAIATAARSQGHRVHIAVSRSRTNGCQGDKVFCQDVYYNMKRNPDAFIDGIRLKLAASRVCRELIPVLQRANPNVVYAHSVNAVVCQGILQAIQKTYVAGRAPYVIAEMPFPCESKQGYFYGAQLAAMFRWLERCDAKNSRNKQSTLSDRFEPITVNDRTSTLLSQTVGAEIGVMPSPYAVRRQREFTSDQPSKQLRIGSVGHQVESKGFDLLPAICESLYDRKHTIHWIIQHQDDSNAETLARLRELQTKGFNIELHNRDFTRSEYESLLFNLDIVLLPYKPERYQSAISGVCYEGLSQGSVVITPRHTTVGKLCREFQPQTPQFEQWTSDSIATAVRKAVELANPLRLDAIIGAKLYAKTNGPDAYTTIIARNATADVSFKPRYQNGKSRVQERACR